MRISVSEAKAQLTELVRRAEAGEEIVLTRHGQDVARIAGVKPLRLDPAGRRAVLEAARGSRPDGGPSAARSQDWLYGDDGLPK